MPGGLFITLEGGDGSGKSTQVEVLALRLYDEISAPVHIVREPGGTALGNWLRQMLKYTAVPRTPEAELLLFNASRAQLVSQVIRPALERGEVMSFPTASPTPPWPIRDMEVASRRSR